MRRAVKIAVVTSSNWTSSDRGSCTKNNNDL